MIFNFELTLVMLIICARLHELSAATIFDRYEMSNKDNSSSTNNNGSNINSDKQTTTTTSIDTTFNAQNSDTFIADALKSTTSTAQQQQTVNVEGEEKELCNNDGSDISSCRGKSDAINTNDRYQTFQIGEQTTKFNVSWQFIAVDQNPNSNNMTTVNNNLIQYKGQQTQMPKTRKLRTIEELSNPTLVKTAATTTTTTTTQSENNYYQYNLIQNESNEVMQPTLQQTLNYYEAAEGASSDREIVQLINIWEDVLDTLDLEDFMRKYSSKTNNKCLMKGLKAKIQWWAHSNGTLRTEPFADKFLDKKTGAHISGYMDFSYKNISNDEMLYRKTLSTQTKYLRNVTIFSAAHNNLTRIPFRTLSIMRETLICLTLKGNQFLAVDKPNRHLSGFVNKPHAFGIHRYKTKYRPLEEGYGSFNNITSNKEIFEDYKRYTYEKIKKQIDESKIYRTESGIAWATFPIMPHLLELDISDCNIEYIEREVFANITQIRRLYMSHNKIVTIPHETFQLLGDLEYLDLSYTNVLKFEFQSAHTIDTIWHLISGVKIQSTTFKNLNKLTYLDLSHTKLSRNSASAFTHLGESLKFMSLCFTFVPIVGNALFKHTGLVGLDLSGNPFLAHSIMDDPFEGIADSLKYLFFDESNLKDLEWLRQLENLNLLSLSGNYIYGLRSSIFDRLRKLQALDLSYNIITNWYTQVFENNTELRILNLRYNNLNVINAAMLKDFETLDYLSLGNNNFVCDCILLELMAMAMINNKKAKCNDKLLTEMPNLMAEIESPTVNSALRALNALKLDDELETLIASISLNRMNMNSLEANLANIHSTNVNRWKRPFLPMRYVARKGFTILRSTLEDTYECGENIENVGRPNDPIFNGTTLKFQLLDYGNDCYWCFNGTNRMNVVQMNCEVTAMNIVIAEDINKLTQIVLICVCSIMSVTLLIGIVYLKRWHIYYYYSSLKSAALLSMATKDQVKKFNELAENYPNMVYDIFISYCQSDREWVLQELLPNVEEAGNISICLHERDFQIGVAILENIISCMDRSRALMLIISSNFLLSHWCQFEMHLAQHRIFEVSREHLIIVFLEDIPINKRPKALQYLMEVKTYIKWPGAKGREVTAEERKTFWKRMRTSLDRIGLSPLESIV